jgi:membrane-bound metal-dependent hydrolase YbcI (DUF457 family)
MTGRTHDLAAFTALNYVFVTSPLINMSLATALTAFTMNMVGGLAPDIDQSTAALYRRVRGGSFLGKVVAPLIGGHRFLSHSLVGVFLFGIGMKFLLGLAGNVLLVDMDVVWWAFMIGFVSHLIADTFTAEGVPWLFPIPFRFGIPPLRALRFKTGGVVEKSFVFPILIIINGYLIYMNYAKFLDFFRHYIK